MDSQHQAQQLDRSGRDVSFCESGSSPSSLPKAPRERDTPVMHAPLSSDAAAFLRRQVDAASERSGSSEFQQLRSENEQLRGQVADLAGALKARDMEIAALRERCQLLLQSIEQQDETIAKIYAVASPATMDALHQQSEATQPPPSVDKKVKEKKERSVSLAEPLRDSKAATPATPSTVAPTPVREVPSAATAITKGSGVLSEAIDRILHATPPPPPRKTPAQTPPRHRRMSLFDDDTSTDDTSPSSCSSTLSKSSSGRPFERRESCASEEDFVKSAGFLRKPSRRSSGRLSISDFGLLDDANTDEQVDAEVEEEGEEEEEVEEEDNQREEDNNARTNDKRGILSRSKSEDFHKKRNRSASSSQRNLFADIDASRGKSKSGSKKLASNQDESTEEEEQEMTYAQFLERLRLPASRDILETIRTFLASILGPRGDGKPPRSTDFVDYEFYGTHEFRRRCMYFFQSMEELFSNHPLWRHASEATLAKARDGVEKYVMDKLEHIAMNQLEECETWKEEDDRLLRRMKLLSFITPDMLDIKPCMRNEVVWSMAEDELRRINSFRSPGDKINCIVRCCSIIFSVLNLSRGDSGSRPGADDFLPVFIYIVLHSKIPRLHSNCEYIAAYRNPNDLMSKAGYCFVNLRSAVEFLSVVNASMLSVSDEDFMRMYEQEERKLLTAVQ